MRICVKCKEGNGSWWDHLCPYCRNMPTSAKKVPEYEKLNSSKGVPVTEKTFTKNKESNKSDTRLFIGTVFLLVSNFILNYYLFPAVALGVIGFIIMKESDFDSKSKFLTYFSYGVLGITTVRILYLFIY